MDPMMTVLLRAVRKAATVLEKAIRHRDMVKIEEKIQVISKNLWW